MKRGRTSTVIYLCKQCGEQDEQQFYTTNKRCCKKCCSLRGSMRYNQLSEADKHVYKERMKLHQDNNIFQFRWLAARARAAKSGIDFSITADLLEQLWEQQGGLCYYSNISMVAKRAEYYSVSIDRLDNRIGYVEGNIVLCCSIVNTMKNTLNVNEFRSIVYELYNHLCKD